MDARDNKVQGLESRRTVLAVEALTAEVPPAVLSKVRTPPVRRSAPTRARSMINQPCGMKTSSERLHRERVELSGAFTRSQ